MLKQFEILSATNVEHSKSHVEVYYGKPTEPGALQLWPAPIFSFTEEAQCDDLGQRQSTTTRISIDGTILVLNSGCYETVYERQEVLRQAFSTDFRDFVVQAGGSNPNIPSGTPICSGLQPKVLSVNIEPDLQFQRADYTIELEAITPVSGVSGVTSSLSNQWSFTEQNDSCTVQVSHP